MTGRAGMAHKQNTPLHTPFCREDVLADIVTAIRTEDCRAVFLTSDNGLGASTILHELTRTAAAEVPVLTIHGSKSLAKIPFGVLTPYLSAVDRSAGNFRINVLRALLAEFARLAEGAANTSPGAAELPLIVIDDAHAVDTATAELVVSLVMSGAVNVVASHSHRHELPAPLPKLWATGMAEDIVLLPLSQEEGHAFCEAMLGGPVLAATSWHYWSQAAGNPMFLRLLVAEAVEDGHLVKHGGTWVGEHDRKLHSRGLEEAVASVLRGISPAGQAALNLIALSEPVAESALKGLVKHKVIRELLDWRLVVYLASAPGQLVLANPVYAEAIREMVPLSQSRLLYEQLVGRLDHGDVSKEALLRRVLWAVEIGIDVPDETMLSAAVLATKLFQSSTAWELADHVQGERNRLRATMVKARAKYNRGDYQGAFLHIESVRAAADNLQDLHFGSLLRASTKSALGMPVEAVLADAVALRENGEALALADPLNADNIRAQSESGATLVELMAVSRSGKYAQMTAMTAILAKTQGRATSWDQINHAMALTLDSERLTAQGFPQQGMMRAKEAFAIEHAEENDVFFLPESILLRHLTAALCAGEWAVTQRILNEFLVNSGLAVFCFGGGANVARGMALLRAGKTVDALDELVPGIDVLKISDPQQLLGFCMAMAVYAAARSGKAELAQKLMDDYVEGSGMFVVVAHERAYLAAARHILAPDAGALAELRMQADAARTDGSALLELNAVVLALEVGDESVVARVAQVAKTVEGPWAKSLGMYAEAFKRDDGQGLADAGQALAQAGLLGFAKQALGKSVALLGGSAAAHDGSKVRAQLRRVSSELGASDDTGSRAPKLTRRESEVARFAMAGMSDREIAEELSVALRTVEGHLYRAYGKLGISAREELAAELQRAARR
ncbi:MAG: LuxR C-terminal-related transcriptional regulator [Specibacter sp.]